MHPIPSDSIIDFKSHFMLRRARNCVCDAGAPSTLRRASPEQLASPELPLTPHQEQCGPRQHFGGASRSLGAVQSRIAEQQLTSASCTDLSECLKQRPRRVPRLRSAAPRRVCLHASRTVATARADVTDLAPDPNAPKRGLSAYMFFANEQRDNVREENPGVSFGQVGKILGERWKALSDKQRTPYEAKAAADKKRYEDEKQAYNVSRSERQAGSQSRWVANY